MHSLSTASIIEKNRTTSDGVYLLLLTIQYKNDDPIRLVRNTENYTFNNNLFYAYYFELSEVKRTTSELPTCTLTVSNITGTIQQLLEARDGYGGAKVTVQLVNTNVPDEVVEEEHFVVQSAISKKETVSISLGMGFSMTKRVPRCRILKDFCPFKYKGEECGATSDLVGCDKTLTACRARGNSARYGGCPTVPQGGLYARDL